MLFLFVRRAEILDESIDYRKEWISITQEYT